MEQSTVTVNTVDWLSVGHIEISLTDWTDGLEPEITAGSVLEIGGSIFYASGDDDLDIAGAWGGIANDTLVYIYYSVSGTTATAELSTTAPTWDDEKQGWYDAGKTKRCVGSIYKDSGGNYDQKTIFLDQFHGKMYQGLNLGGNAANGDKKIQFATDANFGWDEANGYFEADQPIDNTKINTYKAGAGAADVQLEQYISGGAGSSAAFTIKKPITARLTNNSAFDGWLEIQSSTGWLPLGRDNVSTGSFYATNGVDVVMPLNPGTYRLRNSGAGTTTLYALGVYGNTTITSADIVA